MPADRLAGAGVLVTRPARQADAFCDVLEAAGGVAIRFPVIDIVGRDGQSIRAVAAGLTRPDIVIFVSSNAVRFGLPAAPTETAKIAAVGPATREAIEDSGAAVEIFPDGGFDSEHLLGHSALEDVDGKQVVIVRGAGGRELLATTLTSRGANVDYLEVYDRVPHAPTASELADVESGFSEGRIRYVVVMSVQTAENLVSLLPPNCLPFLQRSTLVAPSARVIQRAAELIPGAATALAPGPHADAIIDTIADLEAGGSHP